ncbi:MAG: adenylate/guanylate cyclase domain-containing protein [Candidatus Gracilibacteria bacterium]|nr:adenylate/guanylate cyclase domain-containing protein [Candidatus Gracilibacteria bacterium]
MKKGSIGFLNKLLIIIIFFINVIFIITISKISNQKIENLLVILSLFINIIVISFYFYLNSKFINDFENIIASIKRTFDNGCSITKNESFFIENKKLESLFKKIYIKNNLAKKDLNDLKEVFNKFIPSDIFKDIGFRGYEKIVLGNCMAKNLTVIFLDIVGFTSLSENIKPERALFLLNIYFDGIGEIIHKYGGYIDKFLGDGIMIIFDEEFSDNAILCSIEIQDFIKKFQISTIGKRINIGIGINSGEVIAGTIGTKKRMDATIIGDNVNTASRLEHLTRKYEENIIISKNTYDVIREKEKFNVTLLGKEKLSGKENEIEIYGVNTYINIMG